MVKSGFLDVEELIRKKQLDREKDDEDLREGRVTAEQLRLRNGFFSGVDLSDAKVRIPRKRSGQRDQSSDPDGDSASPTGSKHR